jgi:glycosyltransferase involved in cell wall biosynthesis
MDFTVAISTHKEYEEYLEDAVDSALQFADEVIVYDDGGECKCPSGVRYAPLPKTGSCTLARQLAIKEAQGDRLLHLDGDDWMISYPPEYDCDWYISDLFGSSYRDRQARANDVFPLGIWSYKNRDHTIEGAINYLYQYKESPICGKGIFNVKWLRDNNLSWYQFPHTPFGEDTLTEMEYFKYKPRIFYVPERPFYCVRMHDKQISHNQEEIKLFKQDISDYLEQNNLFDYL